MTTNPSPMAKTEQEGRIYIATPDGPRALFVLYERYATAADLIAALQANPQLRASVLSALDKGNCARCGKSGVDEMLCCGPCTGDMVQDSLEEAKEQLRASEAELVHTREAAELLRDSCADGDLAFRLRLEQWASRDQKRAATTEEQAAPAAVELPGGKGPDYVTRAKLAAALRKLAMYKDADTAPRHIAWQNLANELEAKGE